MTLLIPDAPTLYLNAKLIDGNGGDPVDDAAVLVEGTKITKIGKTADFGEIVFNLIDANLMSKSPQDSRADFHTDYDLSEVLQKHYQIKLDELE